MFKPIALLLTILSVSFVASFAVSFAASAQTTAYNLPALAQKGKIIPENRTVQALPEEKAIRLSAADGDGVAWLEGVTFRNGRIELDIRGKDVVQHSFVGVAFHGISRDSLEAVYFRPFNFPASDTPRNGHMVQYVSHPDYHWDRLRAERTGVFEKPVPQAPNPTTWFHATIVVQYPSVKVYVNHQSKPCLEVTELSGREAGKIGFWVGNTSDGDFTNLVIVDR